MLKDWSREQVHATRRLLQGSSISLPAFPSIGQTGASAAGNACALQQERDHHRSYQSRLNSPRQLPRTS